MTPALVYWLSIAAAGFLAAVGSLIVGLTYYGQLRKQRPELVRAYLPEMVRDILLVLGLFLNLLVGILASLGPIRSGVGLLAVLGGATALSVFAIFNLLLRIGR